MALPEGRTELVFDNMSVVEVNQGVPFVVTEVQGGPRGERGYSAYEVAVEQGFSGTETEWLNSLGTEIDLSNLVTTSDARLVNARTPTSHNSTHFTAGSDPIIPGNIGAANLSHTHATTDISGLEELIRDTIGSALVEGSNVTITVDESGNTITIASTGGGSGNSAWELIQETTLSTDTESLLFSGLESFKNLRLTADATRTVRSGVGTDSISWSFNGDLGANYVVSSALQANPALFACPASTASADLAGIGEFSFPNVNGIKLIGRASYISNYGVASITDHPCGWNSTALVTTMALRARLGTALLAGCHFVLEGIRY